MVNYVEVLSNIYEWKKICINLITIITHNNVGMDVIDFPALVFAFKQGKAC